MTAAEALAAAASRLRAAGVDDPARDARVLLAHAARIDASRVTLIAPEELSAEIEDRFEHMIALRSVRVPVSHLVGERAFYGRNFKVSSDVLDPRPDTETLVDLALAAPFDRVLDLGVGSGCILVSLLAERPEASGLGCDVSEAACLQASANAVLHCVSDRVEIIQSDWFSKVEGQFDLIVANPPYLSAAEMLGVAPELRDHEPPLALTDNADGLSAYRTITRQAGQFLMPNGRLMVEIGHTQGPAVAAMFEGCGFEDVRVLPDLDGRDRVVLAVKRG
jgi:release factor glutamine methyltransferase